MTNIQKLIIEYNTLLDFWDTSDELLRESIKRSLKTLQDQIKRELDEGSTICG